MSVERSMGETEDWLLAECSNRLAEAIEALTAHPCKVERTPTAPDAAEFSTWWRQPFDLGDGVEVYIGASETAWRGVAGWALAAAGIETPGDGDLKGTYREILVQAVSSLARVIGRRLGREVSCLPGMDSGGTPGGVALSSVKVLGSASPFTLLLGFSQNLIGALEPAEEAQRTATTGAAGSAQAPAAGSRTLDLLLEVELPVSVSFGRAQLPLKDVLRLTTGSIVELNRSVSEPVEVIVNNCVIARGEVVVVEGNYGVRIQQIVSRQERLRSLN